MQFAHEFTVNAPVDRVWTLLMNVPEMAECIPGTSGITKVDDTTYDATVVTKVGPIRATFGCRIAILDLDERAKTGAVTVSGSDPKIGGGVNAKMRMALHGDPTGPITVSIASDVDILGKIGQYGHGMLAKRADAMLLDFAACVRANITASDAP